MLLRLYTQSKGVKTSKRWVLPQGFNLLKRPGLTGIGFTSLFIYGLRVFTHSVPSTVSVYD